METTNRKVEEKISCWYAVRMAAKAERGVKEQLDKAGIESYLPLRPVIRLWNGRKIKVMVPVVAGCIFVRLPMDEVVGFEMRGGSFLLQEERRYVSVSEERMAVFRKIVEEAEGWIAFVAEHVPGMPVRVTCGRLKGVSGTLVDCKERNRLAFFIPGLGSLLVEISPDCMVRE